MKDERQPAYDPSIDYEPPYDLEKARRGLKHMYRVSPTYREFSDRLWADGQATARRWREQAEAEPQMRLPLKFFCPWMHFERPNPDAEPD